MADLEFTAEFTDLQLMRRELVGVSKDAQKSAGVFEREFRKAETQLKRTAQANQQYFNSVLKIGTANKSAEQSARTFEQALRKQEQAQKAAAQEAAKAAQKQEQALNNLKVKYDSVFRSSQQFKRELRELIVAKNAGVISTDRYQKEVAQLKAEFVAFGNQADGVTALTNRFAAASNLAGKQTNRLGVVAQQAGFQVGDFLVQIQSGTNPMVAFGQQATQLVGILPLLEGSVSLTAATLGKLAFGLGIGIPLVTAIGAAFMRTRESAEDLNSDLKALNDSLQRYIKTQEAAKKGFTFEEFISQEALKQAEKDLAKVEEAFSKISARSIITQLAAPVGDLFGVTQLDQIEAATAAVEEAQKNLNTLQAKQADARARIFSEEKTNLEEQLKLQQTLFQFGENSLQVRKLQLEQEIAAYDRLIDKQVESFELDAGAGDILKRQNEELLKITFNQNLITEGASTFKDIWETISKTVKDQTTAFTTITKALEDEIALSKVKLQFGKDSAEAKKLEKEQALAAFEADLQRMGLGPTIIAALVTQKNEAMGLADELGRAADNAWGMMAGLSAAFQANSVRAGVEAGAIPPEALADLPQTEAERTTQGIFAARRARAEAARKAAEREANRKSGGGGSKTEKDPREFLRSLEDELRLKGLLVGVNDRQAEQIKLEDQLKKNLLEAGQQVTEADRKRIEAIVASAEALREAEEAEERRKAMIERIEQSFGDAITSMVKGTESIQDAFLKMIGTIVEELFKAAVVDPITSGVGEILGGFLGGGGGGSGRGLFQGDFTAGFAKGGAFSGGRVLPFANGGVVSSPTLFPLQGSQTGLMGEAGPEGILPLKRGRNGKLGVQADISGGENIVINQSFNFSANGDESVKRIIAAEAPKISQMTMKNIVEARQRGGTMKSVFSG